MVEKGEFDDYVLGPFDEPIEVLLSELSLAFTRRWDELRTHVPPEILWHYSGAEGFRAILTFGTLRLSHSRMLNDPTEHAYAWAAISELLDREIAAQDRLTNFFEMTRAVAGDVYAKYHYFIFCLSERSDSLSQWRAYGSGGAGYSLGFASAGLARERDDGEFSLVRLTYDEQHQRALIAAGVQEVRDFFAKLFKLTIPRGAQPGILHRANVLLSQYLLRIALLFKHPSFEDEAEWRLVVGYSEQSGQKDVAMLDKVQFRSDAGLVKAFLDFDFATEEHDNRRCVPLRRVMYGPTLRPVATGFSIEFFLRRRGYSHVSVDKSKVPLEG
jgi:hypothetical protein